MTTKEQSKQQRESDSPLMPPSAIALLGLVGGPFVGTAAAGSVLMHLGRKGLALAMITVMAILSPILYATLILWPVKWYWTSLTLVGLHLFFATALYLLMLKFYHHFPDRYTTRFSKERRRSKGYLMAGIIGGVMLSFIIGLMGIISFLLFSDFLFSTLMPVAFDDMMSLTLLGIALLALTVSGGIAGGMLGKTGLHLSPAKMILTALALLFIALIWLFGMQLTIAIPGFQAGQAGSGEWGAALFPYIGGNFLVGVWWVPFLLFYFLRPSTIAGRSKRLLQIPLINLSGALVLAILFGYQANWFFSGGRFFEQRAMVPAALWCYEQGLSKEPSAPQASYLQYRIALLAHKLGERERAIKGFRRVVAKYNFHDHLVKKSSRFLESLEQGHSTKQRVVLPGVESPTAYKGAYCVPNSLALAMNYWGDSVDARSIGKTITGLGSGTMTVDQTWFARQHGFEHQFLPMATIDDVKTSIDAGFPVLVYVPAHIFAIVGYDEILGTFVTYDVATQDVWVDYIQKDFIKSWKKQYTTMMLVYPKSKEGAIPEQIRKRLTASSDAYLHYHLYYLDTPGGYASSAHLLRGVNEAGAFFAPQTVLQQDFPGLRSLLAKKHAVEKSSKNIFDYYGNDFDEGTHLWGQMHFSKDTSKDKGLEYGLNSLIGWGQASMARDLIDRIEDNGPVSEDSLEIRAILDLALGDLEKGSLRLEESSDYKLGFYLALSRLTSGDTEGAIQGLVDTVANCT